MYKIVGADGKEYGPVNLEQLRQWVAQGRLNAQSHVQGPESLDWKAAAEWPELAGLFGGNLPGSFPPTLTPLSPPEGSRGLAITSLVLGVTSLTCFGLLTGLPAVICGHIAYNRARRSPTQYSGSGMAIAGFVMGYASIVMSIILLALLLPALARAKASAEAVNCTNNMKQLGLAFKVWALDHNGQYPFNVSTNAGGTLEFCAAAADGLDRNSALHLRALSQELATPKILVCPIDTKLPAFSWQTLTAANVTYQVYSGTNVSDANPQAVLAVCPLHGTTLLCDGSVQQKEKRRR